MAAGTANAIPKWSSSSALTDSVQNEVNSKIGIGLESAVEPSAKLEILGSSALLQLTNGVTGSATTFVNFFAELIATIMSTCQEVMRVYLVLVNALHQMIAI